MRNIKDKFIIAVLFITAYYGSQGLATEYPIADFDSGQNPVSWGPNVSVYGVSKDTTSMYVNAPYTSFVNHSPAEGYSLKIEWSGVDAIDEYAGGVITDDTKSSRDVSGYSAISFWIHTPNANTNLSFGLMTTYYITGYVQLQDYLVTGTNVWQNVIVPIAAFKRNNPNLDLTRVGEIKWLSEYSRGNDADGTVYIDDVYFLTCSHAPAGTKILSGRNVGSFNEADIPGDIIGNTNEWHGATSGEISLTVAPVYGASWIYTPQDVVTSSTSQTTAYYAYRIKNTGNTSDKIYLSTSTALQDWPVKVFWDKDRSSSYTNGDTEYLNTIDLLPDSTHYFLVSVYVPASAVSGSSTTVSVTARTNNGSGTNDNWPSTANNDMITDSFTVVYDTASTQTPVQNSSAPVITILKEPDSKIPITGSTDLVFQAEVSDANNSITSVRFIQMINSGVVTDTQTVTLSGTNVYTATVTVTGTCVLTYSWQAINVFEYATQTSSRTIAVSKRFIMNNFLSGTLSLDDTNPYGGTSSISIPSGALDAPITLSFFRKDRTDTDIRTSVTPAASSLPSAIYEFGPNGTNFKKPATITLQYLDTDNNKLEDTSGKDERLMRIFWWDGYEWRLVGGTVDTTRKTVTASIMHFSLYATFPINALTEENYRPKERILTPAGSPGKNDFVQFGVSSDFSVDIFDINGAKVRTLTESNVWRGEDDDGNTVESGVYIYQIKTGGQTISGTILVAK